MGYAGGTKVSPTYHDLGDHTEVFEVGYDPTRISFERLLVEFWDGHSPSEDMWSRQYRSAIFVANDSEREAAERSVLLAEKRLGRGVHTAVEDTGPFWQAEDYHQKYRLRRDGAVWKQLQAAYPDVDDLVRSTAAARLNAWVSGSGGGAQLEQELPTVGLNAEAQERLLRRHR